MMDPDLELVHAVITESLSTLHDEVATTVSHMLSQRGKGIRPSLVLLCAQDEGREESRAVQAAAAIELLHAGSLVYDDVMDESGTRRGVRSMNARLGNAKAVLIGDALLALSSEIAASLGQAESLVLASTFGRLCKGPAILASCSSSSMTCSTLSLTRQTRVSPAFTDMREGVITLPLILAREHDPEGTEALVSGYMGGGIAEDEVLEHLLTVRAVQAAVFASRERWDRVRCDPAYYGPDVDQLRPYCESVIGLTLRGIEEATSSRLEASV